MSPTLSGVVLAAALGLLLLQLGIALFDYARLASAAVSFPFPLDYSEGHKLDQVLRLAQLENIYRNSFAAAPYTVSTSPPLFQLIQAPLSTLFGPAFWYGRLISILSAIAAAALLGLILHALTVDGVAAAVGALTFLSFPYLVQGSLFARGDTLALALSLGGLYALVRGPVDRRPGAPALWVSGLLLTAAMYTGPSAALAAPLAAFVWLLQARQRQAAITLAAITLGTALGLFFGLNLLTRGGFYLNVVLANAGPISARAVAANLAALYLNAGYLLIGCLFFVIVERLGERTRSWPLVTSYLAGATLTVLAAGQAGASGSELLVMAVALCLAAGACLAWTGERHWLRVALVFVLALQVNQLTRWSRDEYIPAVAQKLGRQREVAQLAELVRQAPGPLLADEYMGLLPLYGRRLYFQPFEFRQLEAAGLWSAAPLLAAIERREFSAILLYQPRLGPGIAVRWTPELRSAIYAHYQTNQTVADNILYLPREPVE